MNIVYAFNLRTNRPGIYMPERIWHLLNRAFGRPEHWDFIGGRPSKTRRQFADSERGFYQSGNYHAA